MLNKKLVISLIIFSIFMVITSVIKTKTREIQKNILLYEKKIANLQSHLHEAELDYYYLSSPKEVEKKLNIIGFNDYSPISNSKIFLNISDFTKTNNGRIKLTSN